MAMNRHSFFDLYIHSTAALETVLTTSITKRATIHEWPLSVVQSLLTVDEQEWIYKSARNPSVEIEFYTKATSPLLLTPIILPPLAAGHTHLLLPRIIGKRLDQQQVNDAELVAISQALLQAIGAIEGSLPYYFALPTAEAWQEQVTVITARLTALYNAGTFRQVNASVINAFTQWALSDAVLATFTGDIGLVHHDLTGENVFLLEDGYRVIDWQRPILGPRLLDLASLFESLNRSALPHVGLGIMQLMYLLRIEWFSACAERWFPAGSESYDGAIVALMAKVAAVGQKKDKMTR